MSEEQWIKEQAVVIDGEATEVDPVTHALPKGSDET